MDFLTEFFTRPRRQETHRLRPATTMLRTMSIGYHADTGIRPADFPRVARESARRY